ncbi:helix-turn-helix domain-containing protein, partial [Sutterella sp.]|uniref:helix-turn-helix domain-containing protein n=1 Tax=Sutterella sp. TaxID=1981025 RepID=UPI0026E104F6
DEVQEVPEAAGAAEANDAARPGGFPAWLADPGGSDPDPLTLIADPRSGAVLRAFVRRTSLARERLAASGRGAADADGMRFVSRTIALAESGCFPNPAGLVRLGRILGLRPSFLLWGPAAAAAAGGDALPEDIATAWRLRVLLADAGLNRSALQRPGVTYQDILHWLAGGRIPPAKARLIAEVLKTTPGYLVNGIPGEAAEDPVTNRSETFSPRIVPDAVHRAGLLLEERGLTPGDVDARLGLLPGLCALWLKGVLRPSGRRIGELAELLGTTRGQLLDGRAENTPATKRRRLRGPGATLPERQAAAAALRELMKVRGFSAPALARRLALPRRLVESWLRARKPVDPGCAAALAEALDVTPEELVGRGIIAALPDAARRPEASPVEPALEKKMRAVLARSADRLLELAAERSVPVTSLSHSLGIPYATILAWVRRTALPDTATIAKAAARFGVSVTRLLGDETDPSVIARLQSRPAPGTRVTRRRIRAASPDTGRDALRRAFAANFEALLAASPLSADGLAELLEIRPGRIREWLGGKSVPRAAQLRRLADALDTTPAALLDEGETAGEAGASPDTAGKFEAAAFRRRVDARLLDLGLTRTELSRRLGHPATWLTDLMRSPVVHRGADVTAVADALRTSPDWLLLGRGDAVRAPAEAPAGVPHGEHGEHESPGPGGKERAAINPHAVAARLRNLLKEHGLDAAGLSRDLGINYYTVRSWLLAVSIPSRGNLIAVANFLQVTPARILHGDESGGERTDDAPAGPLLEGIEDAPERRLIGGSSGEVAPGTFAARLGLELERFRVSPAEVARAIGVRDDRVRSWLQDSLLPAEEELAALETWLRLPAGSLMPGGADEEDSSPVSAAPVIRAMPMLLADVNAPEADPQAVADRLMKLLAVNGQTSGDLVRCLQFSPATVRRWVTGEKVPWAANIRILARFFDVEPTWITGGGDEAADPRPSPSAMAAAARLTAGTSSGSDLLGMERADTPEKQAAVLAFGKRLDHAMRAAGLTDRQAAKKLGVSPETVGHLRNGRGVPSLRHLAELAQLVNLTPDELWHGTGKDAPARWTPWTDTLGEVDPVPVFRVVLRRLIAGSGLSLGEIALSLGLEGVDVVKGWLSGRGLPDRDMLAAISNLLETDPSVLEKALEQQTVGYGTVVTFADRFIALVEAEGISYTELARRLEIPPQTLAEWRRGKSVPRRWKLETLAEYFGVTPEHLIEGEPCWRRRPF